MLGLAITPADVQDRDGFLPVLKQVRRLFAFLTRLFADVSVARQSESARATIRTREPKIEVPFAAASRSHRVLWTKPL